MLSEFCFSPTVQMEARCIPKPFVKYKTCRGGDACERQLKLENLRPAAERYLYSNWTNMLLKAVMDETGATAVKQHNNTKAVPLQRRHYSHLSVESMTAGRTWGVTEGLLACWSFPWKTLEAADKPKGWIWVSITLFQTGQFGWKCLLNINSNRKYWRRLLE